MSTAVYIRVSSPKGQKTDSQLYGQYILDRKLVRRHRRAKRVVLSPWWNSVSSLPLTVTI